MHKPAYICLLILFLSALSCEDSAFKKTGSNQTKFPSKKDPVFEGFISSKDSNEVKLLVLPSLNSYDFNTLNYDLDALLSKNLSAFPEMQVIKVPYRKLVGTNVYGIYTGKDALPVIQKVKSDVVIMSRFLGESPAIGPADYKWGYEVKLLNPKNMKSKISIKGTNLPSYEEIEKHIQDHLDLLILDIYELH